MNDATTICVYHGDKRVREVDKLSRYGIVVTTYDTLSNEFRTCEGSAVGAPCAPTLVFVSPQLLAWGLDGPRTSMSKQ